MRVRGGEGVDGGFEPQLNPSSVCGGLAFRLDSHSLLCEDDDGNMVVLGCVGRRRDGFAMCPTVE